MHHEAEVWPAGEASARSCTAKEYHLPVVEKVAVRVLIVGLRQLRIDEVHDLGDVLLDCRG